MCSQENKVPVDNFVKNDNSLSEVYETSVISQHVGKINKLYECILFPYP